MWWLISLLSHHTYIAIIIVIHSGIIRLICRLNLWVSNNKNLALNCSNVFHEVDMADIFHAFDHQTQMHVVGQ